VNTLSRTAKTRIARGAGTAGLLLVEQRLPVATAIDEILLIWSASEAEEWKDGVFFLPL
jgi:hypothetical protein